MAFIAALALQTATRTLTRKVRERLAVPWLANLTACSRISSRAASGKTVVTSSSCPTIVAGSVSDQEMTA